MAFDFSAFPVLITDRIVLRELRKEDAADLLVFRGDAVEQRFNSEPLQTLEQCVALIEEVCGDYAAQRGLPWALTLSRLVGSLGCSGTTTGIITTDAQTLAMTWLVSCVGAGLGHGGAHRRHPFGFSEGKLNRIEAQTIADNEPSTRLLGRLGFAR